MFQKSVRNFCPKFARNATKSVRELNVRILFFFASNVTSNYLVRTKERPLIPTDGYWTMPEKEIMMLPLKMSQIIFRAWALLDRTPAVCCPSSHQQISATAGLNF